VEEPANGVLCGGGQARVPDGWRWWRDGESAAGDVGRKPQHGGGVAAWASLRGGTRGRLCYGQPSVTMWVGFAAALNETRPARRDNRFGRSGEQDVARSGRQSALYY
jgi:hypothetical protein